MEREKDKSACIYLHVFLLYSSGDEKEIEEVIL